FAGVGLEEIEELHDDRIVSSGARLRKRRLHPPNRQTKETSRAVVETNRIRLAEPMHEERLCCRQIGLREQHLNNLAVGLRRVKLVGVRTPKRDRARGAARLMPCCKRTSHPGC